MPEPAPEEAPSAPEMPVVEVFPVGDGVLVPAPEGVAEPPVEAAGGGRWSSGGSGNRTTRRTTRGHSRS